MAAMFAETNRLPFDLPEAEGELVAGYHTEYGGIKMNMFYIGEYGHMLVASALMVTFYFGGYTLYPLFDTGHKLPRWFARDLVRRRLSLADGACFSRDIFGKGFIFSLAVYLGALDVAAFPLRPADGFGLENHVAMGAWQHRGHGRGDIFNANKVVMIMLWEAIGFYSMALFLIFFAFKTITATNPIHSALYLALTMIGLAGVFFQLDAQFIAGVQMIVYAGAVMVLFVMVLMLFDLKTELRAFSRGLFSGFLKIFSAAILAGFALGAATNSIGDS